MTKAAISLLLILGAALIGHAYLRGYPPFASQFVQTCDRAIKERLAVPSTYERMRVDESRKIITHDEFFTDPLRAVSEASRKAMIQVALVPPVQYIALIDYQAQTTVGAVVQEKATCTFNSLDGTDMPERTYWVRIDGEYNMRWAARQPNAETLLRRLNR